MEEGIEGFSREFDNLPHTPGFHRAELAAPPPPPDSRWLSPTLPPSVHPGSRVTPLSSPHSVLDPARSVALHFAPGHSHPGAWVPRRLFLLQRFLSGSRFRQDGPRA